MQSGEGTKPTPQFETAEFQTKPGTDACSVCHQQIAGSYYRINSRMSCAPCAERLKASIPKDSHAAFVRAVTYGAAAAAAGLALYALVGIVTGLVIGYVSLAVGWMVGKAMMKGSGGLGGRRYQLTAILFTYAAVSIAAVPIGIAEYIKEKKPQTSQSSQSAQPAGAEHSANAAGNSEVPGEETQPSPPHRSVASALGYLSLLGLASPFMDFWSDPFHGFIGFVILLVGLRIAWQITRGHPPLVIDGPF
jgi:hypothetical protein